MGKQIGRSDGLVFAGWQLTKTGGLPDRDIGEPEDDPARPKSERSESHKD